MTYNKDILILSTGFIRTNFIRTSFISDFTVDDVFFEDLDLVLELEEDLEEDVEEDFQAQFEEDYGDAFVAFQKRQSAGDAMLRVMILMIKFTVCAVLVIELSIYAFLEYGYNPCEWHYL
jgi:hypothetical protein